MRKLQAELDALKAAGTYKHLRHLTTPMAPEVHMEEAGDVIVLSSNNYLGLSDQPEVIEAGIEGLRQVRRGHGVGALYLRDVRYSPHARGAHRAVPGHAGVAHVRRRAGTRTPGSFATICGEGSAIISDELNHASIIDGVRLASKAKRAVYKHGDMADLEAKLQGRCKAARRSSSSPTACSRWKVRSANFPRSLRSARSTARSASSTIRTAPASWARPAAARSSTSA